MADILIIDDEPQMRRLIGRVLRQRGHTIHDAADGKEGLEVFRRVHPGLVICDIVMPEGEGIETIREISRQAPGTPILAISGGSNQELYLRAATGLGASAALEKPFDPQQLVAAIARLLSPVEQE